MAGLSDTLTAYRAALTTAGFSNLPVTVDIDDLPASNLHKTYRLSIENFGSLGAIHGGGNVIEYFADLRLELYWDPEVDTEAIYNTVGTDMETATGVMLKASNRNTGTILIDPSARWTVTESPNRIKGNATFQLRERITQDLT